MFDNISESDKMVEKDTIRKLNNAKKWLEKTNRSLTLDELREKVEEPIWLQTGRDLADVDIIGRWEILERISKEPSEVFWFTRRMRGFMPDNYGLTWLAYDVNPTK